MIIEKVSTYNNVANEYYDPARHPTCANFNELSARYIHCALSKFLATGPSTAILEVGAGRSVAAPYLSTNNCPLTSLVLLDLSRAMLSYSQEWINLGAIAIEADARNTGLPAGSVDIMIASLGDPYNCPSFWEEASRLLRPGGFIIHTAPALEWAMRFRGWNDADVAEFTVGTKTVRLPSFILKWEEQLSVLEANSFELVERQTFQISDILSSTSSKLRVFETTFANNVITGFTARRI